MLALAGVPTSRGETRLPFLVTDEGIGGITADTVFAPQAVSAALGGLPVKATKVYFDKLPIPTLEATRNGKRVLLAFGRSGGDRVSRAVAYAPDALTSTGVAVGTPMGEVYSRLPNSRCRNGLEEQTGLVFCPAPYFGNVRFAFRCNHATHNDQLPPVKVLAGCPLESIIWLADD